MISPHKFSLVGKLAYAHTFDIVQQVLTHLFNVNITIEIIVLSIRIYPNI